MRSKVKTGICLVEVARRAPLPKPGTTLATKSDVNKERHNLRVVSIDALRWLDGGVIEVSVHGVRSVVGEIEPKPKGEEAVA